MTSKNEKLRGLFLAAIMVTSVFVGSIALTGAAAASAANTATAADVAVGQDSTTQLVTVNDLDQDDSTVYINVSEAVDAGASVNQVAAATTDDDTIDSAEYFDSNNTIKVETSDSTDGETEVDVTINWDTTGVSAGATVEHVVAIDDFASGSSTASFDTVEAGVTSLFIDRTNQERTLVDDDSDLGGDSIVLNTDQQSLENPTQELDIGYAVPAGGSETITIDLTDATDNGVSVTNVGGLSSVPTEIDSTVSVTNSDNDIIEVTLDDDTNNSEAHTGTVTLPVTFDATSLDTVGEIDVEYTASDEDGNSDAQAVATLNRGTKTIVEGTTTGDGVDVGDTNSLSGWNDDVISPYVGEVITIQDPDNDQSVIRVYEATTDDNGNGNARLGDEVAAVGTAPGEVTNFDTSQLEGDEQYFVTIAGDTTSAYLVETQPLSLNAEFSQSNYTTASTLTLDVSTEDLTGSDVDVSLVNDEGTEVATDSTSLDGSGNAEFTFSGSNLGADTYNATVTHVDSQVTDTTADVSVEEVDGEVIIDDVETDQRGDVVNITLDMQNVDTGSLVVGSQEAGFLANATVTDGDGDGEVTLQWNTFLADSDGDTAAPVPQFTVAGDDDTLDSQDVNTDVTNIASDDAHVIASGTYDLSATVGTDPSAEATDLGSVTLNARSTQDITTWTAPAGTEYDNVLDEVTVDSTIANEDLIVTQIDVTGLEGAFEQYTRQGTSPTATFTALAETDDVINFNHTQSVGQASNQQPTTLTINDGNAAVVADTENDTYYVVQDTAEVDVSAGEDFGTNFAVISKKDSNSNFGLVSPEGGEFNNELAEGSFSIEERTGAIDTRAGSDLVEVSQASGQTITGTSSVAPGTELNVRVQSQSGSGSQFVIGPRTVEVTDNNTWSIEADFSSRQVGTEFTVRLREPGASDNLDTADGVIQGPPEVTALEVSDQEGAGEVVSIDEVELNQGGFIAIHQGSPSGDVIGNSEYIEPNENVQNLRFVLDETLNSSATLYAMPHQDDNNNEEYDFPEADAPYTEGGSAVTAEFDYTLAGATADFQVSNLNPMDVTVTAGDVINVSATITNEGNAAGTQDVEFRVGGSVIDSQEVSLDSGASQDVEFTNIDTTGLSGELDHGVFTDDGDQTATLTVEAPTDGNDTTPTTEEPTTEEPTTEEPTTEEPATEEPTDEPTDDETTTTTGPGFGAIVALVALLGAALLAVRRNN